MAETGLDLVEDQQEAELVGQIAQTFQITGLGFHHADILEQRLGDQRRHGIAAADIAHRLQVVVIDGMDHAGLGDGGARPQGAQRIFAGRDARPDLGQGVEDVAGQLVVIAVIAALHHDHMRTAGDGAGDADGQRGRLAAGVEQRHLVHRRDMGADQFGQLAFQPRGTGAEQAVAARQGQRGGLVHGAEIMAQEIGREARMIIHIALARGVPQMRALALHEGDGRIDAAVDRRDAARNEAAIVFQNVVRRHDLFIHW